MDDKDKVMLYSVAIALILLSLSDLLGIIELKGFALGLIVSNFMFRLGLIVSNFMFRLGQWVGIKINN